MNQRAHDLAVVVRGVLRSLGPGARSLSIDETLTWVIIRLGLATDEHLRVIAEDFGLEQAKIERRGRLWWRSVATRQGGIWMVPPWRSPARRDSEPWSGG